MKNFDDGRKLCLITFFLLGNYFAVFGLRHSEKAFMLHMRGDNAGAQAETAKARKWALWGLIPSTIINLAIIGAFIFFAVKVLLPLFKLPAY